MTESAYDIDDFIASEKLYFSKFAFRKKQVLETEVTKWHSETVAERHERVSCEVFTLLEGEVRYGPLKGLRLSDSPSWGKSDLGAQLLGIYELEILSIMGELTKSREMTFLNIGAADGYYAVGLLKSNLVPRSIAFEQNSTGRSKISEVWEMNGCPGELQIFGEAHQLSLLPVLSSIQGDCLILVDVEGSEFEILSNEVLAAARNFTLIIEIHNWVENFDAKYETFLRNTNVYFDIQVIRPEARDMNRFWELRDFTDDNRWLLASERRPCLMRFLKLTPRN